jgi:hypothetical protein
MCEEKIEEFGYDYDDCDCDDNKQLSLDIMEILMDAEDIKLTGSNKKNVDDFMKCYGQVYDKLEEFTCCCEDDDCVCEIVEPKK